MRPSFRKTAVAVGALVLSILCTLAGVARAVHDGGADCYNCHALNVAAMEPGTVSMAKAAMAEIKSHGWVPGMRLGCTFCHRTANNAFMPDVLSSFAGSTPPGASRHPVARNYVTGAFDNTPYLSTDNTSFAQHLDCRDCHNTAIVSVPDHDNNWLNNVGNARTNNPFGLRNVTANKAYDALCRACHGRGVTAFPSGKAIGKNIELVSHDNAVDNTANAIRDLDNTHLRTQYSADQAAGRQCSVCHDAHESQNAHLFSDGHERNASGAGETAIDELTDCTTVCHYRGDPQGGYDTHGHGKAVDYAGLTLGRDCAFCHDTGTAHNMRNFATDNNYFRKYRFQAFDQSWVTPSVYGKPVKSVCATCHAKAVHATSKGSVGCIDCHDQHAKNSDNNVMMIRQNNRVAGSLVGVTTPPGNTIGSEPVLFTKSQLYPAGDNVFHYFTDVSYQGDGTPGFCDQRACHGAGAKGGTNYIPMNVYLASGQHSGGPITSYNGNCESCHGHNDLAGSFRAQSACTLCHGAPPPPQDNSAGEVYVYNEFLSPHRLHAGLSTGQYRFSCQKCHVSYTSGATHNTTPKTFQSVFFDNGVKRGASAYDNATLACTNIYCHSDARGGNPNRLPQWFNPSQPTVAQQMGCSDCHSVTMTSGAHTQHIALTGVNCSACHVTTVNDNGSALNATTGIQYHVNMTIDVTIKAVYDSDGDPLNNYDNVAKTCSQIVCHGGNTTTSWNPPVPGTCDQCHSYSAGVPVTANVYDYTFGGGLGVMSKVALGNFQNRGHGDNNGLPWDNTSQPGLVCTACHTSGVSHDNALNPFRFLALINTRTVAPDNVDSLCTACHTNYLTRSRPHDNATTGGGQLHWAHDQKCVDCHDVHGQTNIFMVYDNLAAVTDNTNYANSNGYGVPLFPGNRSLVTFPNDSAGSDFASTTLDGQYGDGICETCHRRTQQYRNAAGPNAGPNGHPTRGCLECHPHAAGFAGFGGNNVEQFFDNLYRPASASDFNDRSGHPISENTVNLTYPAESDCLTCHGASPLPSAYRSNECLKCHFEKRSSGTPYHPNGLFEWAIPRTPNAQFGAAGPATDAFCLQCHGGSADNATLGSVVPFNVLPAGESWVGGSGHGSTARLSGDVSVGPPAYSCRDCHYSSTAMTTSPNLRDNRPPTFHASLNRKMVGNTDNSIHEYPHPLDTDPRYNTVDGRSGQMDWFCGTRCHGNAANADPRDDNVVTHTWPGGGTQSGSLTHPSDMAPTPSARFRAPDNLPLSENLTGAPPAGAGNEVCVTCHNPHGGAAVVNGAGAPLTGGNRQMMRRSWSDNASTSCKECHL